MHGASGEIEADAHVIMQLTGIIERQRSQIQKFEEFLETHADLCAHAERGLQRVGALKMSGQRVEGIEGPVVQLRMRVEHECLHELRDAASQIQHLRQAGAALRKHIVSLDDEMQPAVLSAFPTKKSLQDTLGSDGPNFGRVQTASYNPDNVQAGIADVTSPRVSASPRVLQTTPAASPARRAGRDIRLIT